MTENPDQPIIVSRSNIDESDYRYLTTEIHRLQLELDRIKGNHNTCMENCTSLNSIHDGLLRFVRKGKHLRCIYGNESIRKMLDFELSDLIGRSLQWFFSPNPETHRKVDLYFQESKKAITLETYFKSGVGSPIPVLCSIKHNNESNIDKREYLVVVVDIRVLKSAQENTKSILHAERISTLGHLAAGIAHEINNPLSFLLMDVERQRSLYDELRSYQLELSNPVNFDNKKELEQFKHKQELLTKKMSTVFAELEEISESNNEGLKRISEVVKAVKTYGKSDDSISNGNNKNKTTNISEIINVAVRLIQTKLKKSKIDLIKNYQETPNFSANPGRLVQVILNLLLNSIQAIERDDGKIEIRTSYLQDTNEIIFEVEDNGAGITPDDLKKIFNPYFTTKKDGTGLGLGIISNIIADLRGHISVTSKVGLGTTFLIKIPVKKQSKNDPLEKNQIFKAQSFHQEL